MQTTSVQTALRSLGGLLGTGALALSASAQTTWVVDVNGPNAPGSGTPADPYTSIQHAIQQPTTVGGDTVSVRPGVYFENVDFLGKGLRVLSTDGPDVTLIDAGGVGSVVNLSSGEPTTTQLEGFTLQNGRGTLEPISGDARGGGVHCVNSNLALRDCIVKGNATIPAGGGTVQGDGGGIYVSGASFFFVFDCEVEDNRANRGGGVWCQDTNASVFFSALRDNTAEALDLNHAGIGGGLGAQDTVLNFDSVAVERNEAQAGQFVPARGGGLLVWGGSGSVLNALFADNVAGTASSTQFTGQGGGLEVMFLNAPEDLEIAGCELTGNLALSGGGFFGTAKLFVNEIHGNTGQSGAGIYSMGIDMRQTDVVGNVALLPAELASGLGVFTDPTSFSTVTDCTISGHEGMGQGIGVRGGDFSQCQITGNRAVGPLPSSGGGAFAANLVQCTVEDNQAHQTGSANPISDGGGIASCNAARCRIFDNSADQGGGASASSLVHCTVSLNTATNGSTGGGVLGGGTMDSCIVWDNQPQDAENATADFSNVGTGLVGGLGNITTDPMFWQPLNEDFYLRPGSPCIDSGNPLGPPDPDGSTADMGALPFWPGHFAAPFVYCTAKVNSQGCTPDLFTTNVPSLSLGGGQFRVEVNNVLNQQNGILFWGGAPAAIPFQGGTLCVGPPVTRTAVQSSGGNTGTTDCSGSYSFQWTAAYTQSQNLQAFDRVFAQFWSRDPGASFGTGLSAAVDFTFIQ